MGRKNYPRKQKINLIFFSYKICFKGANKEVCTFNKCLPVEDPLHWIKEVNKFFCSPHNGIPENETGRADLLMFFKTIPICNLYF